MTDSIGTDDIPTERVRELLDRSKESGNELAVSFCPTSDLEEGTRFNVEVPDVECDTIGIVHSHPGGSSALSEQDRDVLDSPGVGMVCAATPDDGDMTCEIDADGGGRTRESMTVGLADVSPQQVTDSFEDGSIRFRARFTKKEAGYVSADEARKIRE